MLTPVLYVASTAMVVLLLWLCLRLYGRRPGAGQVLAGFAAATALTFVFMGLTTILSPEGNPFRLVLLFWIGSWLLLCFVQPLQTASLFCFCLFALLLALSFHHIGLATSRRYTDNPPARLRRIRVANLVENRRSGRTTPPPKVILRSVWHTWLTGLYEVHGPAKSRE